MKSFKHLLNEMKPQYHTPASLYGGDPDAESRAIHQANRLKKVAGKIAGDREKAKRVSALGRAISLPLRATDKGNVEYAHSATDPMGKPGQKTAISSGTPIEKVTMTRDVFGLPGKGMQGAFDSAGTARNLSRLAKLDRARRLKLEHSHEENMSIHEAAKKSLSRLRQHIEDGHMVGLISASRGNLPTRENNARTKQLMDSLRKHGYTPIAVSGEYVEDHNGEKIPVREKSFMIHSGSLGAGHPEWSPDSLHREFISDLKKHGEMFAQDTVLSVSKKHGSVFHGTGESTWVPKGKRTRIGGSELQAGAGVEKSDFKSRLAGRPFLMGGGS